MRATTRIAVLTSMGFVLAGCATTTPPAVTAPPIVPDAAQADSGGAFKIGTPYQVDGKWYYPAEDYAYVQEGIASWYGQDFHGKKTANGEKYDMNAVTAAHPTLPLPSVVRVTNLDNGRQLSVRVNDRGPFHSSRIIDLSRRAAQLLGFYEVGTARVRVEIDATESLNLKNLALKEHPPEMPKVTAAPREAISTVALAPMPGMAPVTAMSNEVLPPAKIQPGKIEPAKAAPADAKQAKTPPAKATAKAAPSKALPGKPAPKQPDNSPPTRIARADPGREIPGFYIQAGAFADPGNASRLEEQLRSLGNVVIVPVTVNDAAVYRVRVGPFANAAAAEALLDRVKGFSHDDAKVVHE